MQNYESALLLYRKYCTGNEVALSIPYGNGTLQKKKKNFYTDLITFYKDLTIFALSEAV